MASSSKKKKLNEESESCSLPAEVMQVAQRIGLRTNVPVSEIRTFVQEVIGDKEMEKLKHQTYNIRDLEGKMLRFAQQKHHSVRRAKQGVLTSDERKKLFDVRGKTDLKYDTFLGLHHLWLQYMRKVLTGVKSQADQVKILKADFHGAAVVVDAARNPDLIHVSGIVVQETKNMLRLITPEDRILSVPKTGTILAFAVDETLFKIDGAYISISPPARSKIKIKARRKGDDV